MALQQFLRALEDNPADPYLHYDLAWAYDLKEALDKAEMHLEEAVRLKPDYSEAYNYLGVIYFRGGRVDMAIEAYQKALSNLTYVNPQHAHFNLGVAYLSRNEYEKAAEQFQRAVRLVPDYAAAHNNLGRAYEGLEQYRKARASYARAIDFAPEYAEAHLNLGKLLYRAGETQAAAESFEEVVDLAPGSNAASEAQRYLNVLR
jgi:tetratricopeptide (TPR) repeat protein